jgi:hypothetical protein
MQGPLHLVVALKCERRSVVKGNRFYLIRVFILRFTLSSEPIPNAHQARRIASALNWSVIKTLIHSPLRRSENGLMLSFTAGDTHQTWNAI